MWIHRKYVLQITDNSFKKAKSDKNDQVLRPRNHCDPVIIGYKNPQKALRDHVDTEDKLTERIVLSGQRREVIFINESGLYSLVLSSKLPQAKAFKRWVTSEGLSNEVGKCRRMIRMWIHRKYVLQITDNSFKKVKSDK